MSAPAADAVTVLRCAPGRRATKLITGHPDGSVSVDGYDTGKHFMAEEHPATGIHDLAALLDRLSRDASRFVVRGEPRPDINRRRCRRLLYQDPETGDQPTFREVPRCWAILDFDSVPGPYRFDPRDGEMAAIYSRTLLPSAWQRCSYWWGLSSSACFKPGVRIKLAFWFNRPVLGAELERHLKGCPIDSSTLRAVQPIYVARPILRGVRDPIARRTGMEGDIHDAVPLPELPADERPTYSPEDRSYVSGSPQDVAELRLSSLCRAVERAGVGGRHRCLVWAAARAVELDDAIPRASIADALIEAAQRAGLEDSDGDLARQVRNGFKLGIFGTGAAA